jgi:alpha-L-rhamnosidase
MNPFKFTAIILTGFVMLYLSACQRSDDNQQSGIAAASWITDNEPVITPDSLLYGNHPASVFMKKFRVNGKVKTAEMEITAAGYYDNRFNGIVSGEQRLDPAWTDFSDRVYFRRIDVTGSIRKGSNTWMVSLGNGFYNPLPMRMWGNLNLREHLPVGKPQFIASLKITLESGKVINLHSDGSWQYRLGPVVRNNVYLGEWFDARLDDKINSSLNHGKEWKTVVETNGPGGKLAEAFFPPIMVTREVPPVSITSLAQGKTMVDFGQNLAGTVRIRVTAQSGDTIRLRYGERIYPDGSLNPMTSVCGQIKRAGVGGPGAPALAQQEDIFIASGKSGELYEPRFTFHGFRYIEISGLTDPVKSEDIMALRMNTAVNETGFTLSSASYLNKLDEVCSWTFLSNLFSVQSDCPAREKFGYGGDINATAEAFIYNYDMSRIYKKAVYDWVDAMENDRFVDTAPFVGLGYCGISWESAFLNLQYWLWLHYQDSLLVKELYDEDVIWMDKVARLHPNGLVDKGLTDHESLEPASVELTGSCHYLQAARIMQAFASLMNKPDDEKKYAGLAMELKKKIAERFWFRWNKGSKFNDQTRLACLLDFEVLDGNDKNQALNELIKVLEQDDFHIKTGIFGTKALLNSLSKMGRTDIAYKVVNQEGFSGWKFMIDQGATTLWETWKESDNTFSQNHPMFGSVSEWYNKWIGGIMPDEIHPGSGLVIMNPQVISGLDSVSSERTVNGERYVSHWIRKEGVLHFNFEIPQGKQSRWIIPHGALSIQNGANLSQPVIDLSTAGGSVPLCSGKHHYIVKMAGI